MIEKKNNSSIHTWILEKKLYIFLQGKNTQKTDKQSSYLWEGNYIKGTWGLSVTFFKTIFTVLTETVLCNHQTAFTQKNCLPGSHPRRKNKISNTNLHTDTQTHTRSAIIKDPDCLYLLSKCFAIPAEVVIPSY